MLAAASHRSGRGRGPRFGVRAPLPGNDLAARAQARAEARLRRHRARTRVPGPERRRHPARAGRPPRQRHRGLAEAPRAGPGRSRAAAVALDRRRLRLAQALGASGVIEVPMFGACRFPDTRGHAPAARREDDLLVDGLRALAPDIERTGVTLLLEPLTKLETHYMNLQAHGARIIERSGIARRRAPQRLLPHADGGAGRRRHADGRAARTPPTCTWPTAPRRTEPGSLPFDYRPGFRALKRAGFDGWLTMECKADGQRGGGARRALAYIKRQWAEA